MRFILRNIKVPLDISEKRDYDREAVALAARWVSKNRFFSRLPKPSVFSVCKKSVDARKKQNICFIYSVMFSYGGNIKFPPMDELEAVCAKEGVTLVHDSSFGFSRGCAVKSSDKGLRPVVVGFGPCGMFAALILAIAGCRPIVLERGDKVDERAEKVETYWQRGILDEESNVQFGEGGAGTFSDGKLLTRINDPLCSFVLETLHEHGASDDILVNAKPHIGTDKLREIVKSIRLEIESLGGEVHFNTRFDGCKFNSAGTLAEVSVSGKETELLTDALILCPGHSARDTFKKIYSDGISLVSKPFSVGVRVEHLQEAIDKGLYGEMAGHPALPKGEYALSRREGDMAVYTFCMCPGGTVVASASENGTIVTNGMSESRRDGINANSAVAVSISDSECGKDPFLAIEYQRKIEISAFECAGSNGAAPIMTMGDFLGMNETAKYKVFPTYTGKTAERDIREIFPSAVSSELAKGFRDFDRKLPGFADAGAILTAPETRTSSPVRIPRGETRSSEKYPCLFPCGEGAGYAGGITSAAVDGIKTALEYLGRRG